MNPTASTQTAREAARHQDGEFGTQQHAESGIVDVEPAARDLTILPPTEIDAELYVLYAERLRLNSQLTGWFKDLNRSIPKAERGDYTPTLDRAAAYLESAGLKPWTVREIERDLTEIGKLHDLVNEVTAKENPLNEEYNRRGGWTRAFLVAGLDGHVHYWMNCQTCNHMGQATRFQWMTDYSGQTEEQIVEAAGERACTVCYPTAPVAEKRPTLMFSHEEVAAAKAREERDAVKAAKAAKAAAVAVYGADGGELRVPDWYNPKRGETIKTERAASNKAIDAARHILTYGDRSLSTATYRDILALCVTAIATKRGVPEAEVLAEIEKKAAKPVRY
jgi:hypothetical protein